MSKHTPGDWHAQHRITQDGKGGTKRYHILAGSDRSIQICTMPGWDEEDEANAKLVASAPRLLALVRAWLLTNPHGEHSDACRAVIELNK